MAERKKMGKHRNVNLTLSCCGTYFLWWRLSNCIVSVLLILSKDNIPEPSYLLLADPLEGVTCSSSCWEP